MDSFAITHCIECGKPLVGRKDKKFCDTECRAAHHNKNKSPGELEIQHIQAILRHNRKILKTLCPQGKATVRRELLNHLRYDYRYFTGTYKSAVGTYYLCYDYGFAPIMEGNKQKALIIQRQEYMDKPPDPWTLKPGQ